MCRLLLQCQNWDFEDDFEDGETVSRLYLVDQKNKGEGNEDPPLFSFASLPDLAESSEWCSKIGCFCGEDGYHPDKEGLSIKKGALVSAYESGFSLPKEDFDKYSLFYILFMFTYRFGVIVAYNAMIYHIYKDTAFEHLILASYSQTCLCGGLLSSTFIWLPAREKEWQYQGLYIFARITLVDLLSLHKNDSPVLFIYPSLFKCIIEMIKQKLRESDCYINQPFLAETFCMTAQIASAGDKLHIFYNLCAAHDGNSCAYEGFCPQDKRLYECASAKTMHTIHGIPGYRMRGSTTPWGVFSCLTSRGLDRVWGL